jgi:hypothetical protein
MGIEEQNSIGKRRVKNVLLGVAAVSVGFLCLPYAFSKISPAIQGISLGTRKKTEQSVSDVLSSSETLI